MKGKMGDKQRLLHILESIIEIEGQSPAFVSQESITYTV